MQPLGTVSISIGRTQTAWLTPLGKFSDKKMKLQRRGLVTMMFQNYSHSIREVIRMMSTTLWLTNKSEAVIKKFRTLPVVPTGICTLSGGL